MDDAGFTETPEDDDGTLDHPLDITPTNMRGGPIPFGYDHNTHFYLSPTKHQVIPLEPGGHTEMALRGLAPLEWYRRHFRWKSSQISWKSAAETLMRFCEQGGVFNVERLRGRGAHEDNGRFVIHLGDRLIMDGEEYRPGSSPVPDSAHIYEAGTPLDVELGNPLTDAEAGQYFDLIDECSWKLSGQAILAAGWVVIAPICGILPTRPAIWMSGESGSGKTWILDELIHAAIGPMLIKASLRTTEAGLRRSLRVDALPVSFNEAETRSLADAEKIQKIVELSRASYDREGAKIIMGDGKDGAASVYKIKSIFCFVSIGAAVKDAADINRTVMLEIDRRNDEEWFSDFCRRVVNFMRPGFSGRMISRTFSMIPTIMNNIKVFGDALAEVTGDRRIADTLSPLLAGYASLRSSRPITYEGALEIVRSRQWIGDMARAAKSEAVPDHQAIMDRVLETIVEVGSGKSLSVGEMIQAIERDAESAGTSEAVLMRHGVRVYRPGTDASEIWLARAHTEMERIFKGTQWASSWARILCKQHPKAHDRGVTRFGGVQKGCVALPMSVVAIGDR